MLRFASLSTPAEDGQILVEPKADQLASLVEANHRLLARAGVEIHGRPLAELRRATRAALTDARDDRPLVVTGHQPELYHAGVWAKNIVTSRLAEAVGGRALNLIVDNDAPKKTSITVPHLGGKPLRAHEVPFAEFHAGWAFEQFDALEPHAAERLLAEIRSALGEAACEASALPLMAPALTGQVPARDFVDQVVAARKQVEACFGLTLIERRVSACWAGPMLLDIILNAARFAECYNAALADYRRALGIPGTSHPVPDLHRDGGRIELPVWVYRRGEARHRLFVESAAGETSFYAEAFALGSLGTGDLRAPDGLNRLIAATDRSFRPRALTLTLWARALVADLFIHGIGGAKYDRITDRIMESYLGIRPPEMACVSATLRMPIERFPVTRADLSTARRKRRDAHHNPQRYLSAITADLSGPLQRRIECIAESERLRRDDRLNHPARRAAFLAIRHANADLLAADPGLLDRLAAQIIRVDQQLAHNAVADGREYFFGLLPISKLEQLARTLPSVDRLRGRQSGPGDTVSP
jgi:hypothetical protein